MENLSKFVIFSTLTFLLIVGDISHGYEYGPIIDGIVIYMKQFSSFIKFYNTATKIKYSLANDIPYPNVPQYPLTDRNVPFYLYTRKNPDVPEILYADDSKERLLQSGFDPSLDTVLFAHGYTVTFDDFASNFTTALFPRKNINIIFVVWDSYSFFDAVYTEIVTVFKLGDVIVRFVRTLFDVGADRKNMNFIGHSDGVATLALAAKQIHPRVGRFTAFDPVGNLFNFLPPTVRISVTDADYVQIVHCTVGQNGLRPEITGDVTFYMNGALIQPQCVNNTKTDYVAYCSHLTCLSYMTESLKKNDNLLGIKCAGFLSTAPEDFDFSDRAILSYEVSTSVTGKYCVYTNSPPPPVLNLMFFHR